MLWCKLLVLSIALISLGDCRNPRIIGGRNATIKNFPYQASIQQNRLHECGGAIISEKHIITAAHCVFEEPVDSLTVLTGTSYTRSGKRHEIAKIIVHPNYRLQGSGILNDIAVIELKDRIIFDESQRKINLPQENFKIGQKANLTGWGISSEKLYKLPEVLQALEMEIVPIEECQTTNSNEPRIYNNLVCVKTKTNSGACHYDSGSPTVANGEIVGIVSWTWSEPPLRVCGYVVVNTNVYNFKDFIESAMKYS